MKKIVMILAMAATVTYGYAQDDKNCCGNHDSNQPPTKEQMEQRLATELGLTDQQTKELAALNEEYADVLQGPGGHGPGKRGHGPGGRHGHGGPKGHHGQHHEGLHQGDGSQGQRLQLTDEQREQMKAKMEKVKARRGEYDKKVQQILTKEQYEKVQQMRQQRSARPDGRHGKGVREDKKEKKQKQ